MLKISSKLRKKSDVGSSKSDLAASKSMNSDMPLTHQKRKLYSSKYESNESYISAELDNENHNFKSSKMQTPQYTSTCYKDIVKDRQKKKIKPRTGKSKVESETPSPRTKKMNDVFDQLKETVECSDNVILADKKSLQNGLAINNVTSDSEDDYFSLTTMASANSMNSTCPNRSPKRLGYSETVSSDEVNKKSVSKQKKTVKHKTSRKRVTKRQNNLIDERMRDVVSDKLSTSIVEKHRDDISEELLLKLDEKPQMEAITDETVIEAENNVKPKKQMKKQVRILQVKKEKTNSIKSKIKNDTEREKEVINLSTTSDARSEKSIATVGKSPITAHGDFDEVPPDFELLTEKFKPRDLEIQDLNQSIKDYFYRLRFEESNVPADDRRNSIGSDNTRIIQRLDHSDSESPVVSLKRLTFDDFAKWLPSRKNSETDSSSSRKTVKDDKQKISFQQNNNNEIWTTISEAKKNKKLDLIAKTPKLKKVKENVVVTLSDSNKSTAEKSSPNISRLKRKSDSPTNVDSKRRKLVNQLKKIVVASESVPSVSSVNEWFRRNETVSSAESITASFHESIKNVMEKLDTTLLEIHENTSKKFVHMFVDVQKHLVEVKHERREMYKSVAREILGQVIKVIDEKFADLDKRSQEMDVQIAENLKSQSVALLRADCARKQAMVALLREDLQETLARMEKKKL